MEGANSSSFCVGRNHPLFVWTGLCIVSSCLFCFGVTSSCALFTGRPLFRLIVYALLFVIYYDLSKIVHQSIKPFRQKPVISPFAAQMSWLEIYLWGLATGRSSMIVSLYDCPIRCGYRPALG